MSFPQANMATKVVCLSLIFFSSLACMKASAYTYTGSTNTPQGQFFDSNGKPVTATVGTNDITFSGTVVTIGSYAFHNCNGLKKFKLPSSVTKIGYFAFSNCNSLTEPIYNSTIFARLPVSTTSYEVASGTKKIASAAFRKCTKLTSILLPSSITTLGESAFADCSALTSITIPENTTTIGEYAFKNCTKLSTIYVESSKISNLEANAFYGIDKSSCVLIVPNGEASAFSSWGFDNLVEQPDLEEEQTSVITVQGSYSGAAFTALNDYINTSNALVVDLTNATKVSGEFSLDNPNVLFKTSKSAADLGLQNTNNIVVNGVCNNLVITDKYPFCSDADFKAKKVSYSRNMNYCWGTICLPFKVTSNANVQYYTSGSVSENILTLNTATSVPAGTPAIFKNSSDNSFSVSESGNAISVVGEVKEPSSGTGIRLQGTFEKIDFELTEDGLYYIAQNKFWRKDAGDPLMINTFRAWFTLSSDNAPGRSLSIEESENESLSLKALESISEGTALYFDEDGRQRHDLQKGMNIVKMPDGTTKKVLIK